MGRRIIITEKIIRVETNDGRTEDFPDEGDQYSGGRYNAYQYIREAREQELEPEVYMGSIVTDMELVDNL